MDDATTTTGTTVPAAAIEQQLLFTEDSTTRVRAKARATISERAAYAYGSAYALSGGGDLHRNAHDVALTNLLHRISRGVLASALHHLRPLLPDLTDEQWDRIDAAVIALDFRGTQDLCRLAAQRPLASHAGVLTAGALACAYVELCGAAGARHPEHELQRCRTLSRESVPGATARRTARPAG
ncbi:hypothetical protein AB0B21_39845 [Streptomyces rimosus]|uniref:hypothetical protein n=1 Tax=Streptomyces rimosus TaxID=1927 RepID=UPI00051967C5|nr:hypothetical protein [Streptomyces rimosus]